MDTNKIAYFSMEIGLRDDLPTYSGGLGVLAGDTIKSAADLGLPMTAVTLLYRQGYFRQSLDREGKQSASPVSWQPEKILSLTDHRFEISLEGRSVKVQVWQYKVEGVRGEIVPVFFLDTDIEGNSKEDRALTGQLYGGDDHYRLSQEVLLGVGGVFLLERAHRNLDSVTFHMNEGHAALLGAELLRRVKAKGGNLDEALEQVKSHCVFTTHTPVRAGHDSFTVELAKKILDSAHCVLLEELGLFGDGRLNMTSLALKLSRFTNGVAKKHGEVSQKMFPSSRVHAITNGVHTGTWVAPSMAALFDKWIGDWRVDSQQLRYAWDIEEKEVEEAHKVAKRELIRVISAAKGVDFDVDAFTIGFARRAASYKRADLLFQDLNRLSSIAEKFGTLQIVFSGKAHPKDLGGQDLIKAVYSAKSRMEKLNPEKIKIVYLEDYGMTLGALITAGTDLWLNNPVKPLEASGTSGMKAALNGVPSLSTLDGWWVEGCIEGVTGWEIEDSENALGSQHEGGSQSKQAAANLYSKLENQILPLFQTNRAAYSRIRRQCIAINGSFFNTQRMVEQYRHLSYRKFK